jgi:hypothetical protein
VAATVDRIPPPDGPTSAALVVKTVTKATYPTAAVAAYAVQLAIPVVVEVEGAVPTFTDITGTFYAINLGTAIPPAGTHLLVELVRGRWVFTY